MLRILAKYLLYSLILFFILLLIVLVFRVPLINYVIKENAPEGVTAKINDLKFRPFSRGLILEGFTAKLAEPELGFDLARVELKGLGVSTDLNVSWKSLQLNGIQLQLTQQQLSLNELALGTGQWQQEQGLSLKQLKLRGINLLAQEPEVKLSVIKLVLNDIALDKKLALRFKVLQLDSVKAVLAANSEQPATVIDINKIRLQQFGSDLQKNLALQTAELQEIDVAIEDWQWNMSLASFSLDAIKLKDFNEASKLELQLAKINLDKLLWQTDSQQEQPIQALSLEQIQIDEVGMKDNLLAIKQAGIGAVLMHVIRDKEETINLQPPAMDTAAEQNVSEADEASQKDDEELEAAEKDNQEKNRQEKSHEQKQELLVRLAHLTLLKPAKIHWHDQAVKPAVKETLLIKAFDLQKLSTLAADPDAQLKLLATFGKHGDIDLKGKFHPLTVEDNFAFELKVQKLELPGISPYAEQGIGYALESGQFNLDLLIKAQQAQLDGKAKLDLFNVNMRVEDEAISGRVNQELTMPLPTAIYLLEDSKKHITLTMPLKGSMDDPNFSWSGIMRFITLKAIRTASVYYLKQAILPQTTLVSLVDLFGGMVYNKITELPPMPYQAGVVELNKSHKKLLDQVAKTMQKKDKLSFRLCATANSADGDKEQALKLADQRVDFIRQYLVAEKKINSGRLLSCLSKYEAEAKNSVVMIKL